MRIHLGRLLTIAISWSMLASCSSSGSPTGTVAAFDAKFATFICDLYANCPFSGDGNGATIASVISLTQTECEQFTRALDFKLHSEAISAYVDDGTIAFSPTAAEACIESIGRLCGIPRIGPFETGPCADVFTGLVAEGAPCFIDEQCAGETFCTAVDWDSNTSCTAGVCAPRLVAGTLCERDAQCARASDGGSQCEYEDGTNDRVCQAVSLRENLSLGEVCGVAATATGFSEGICAEGLFCRTPDGGTSTCATPVAENVACDANADACEPGLVCTDDGTGPRCRRLVAVRTAGASCDALNPCNLFLGLVCMGGVCTTPVGDGTVGAVCRMGENSVLDCDAGLYCDEATLRCAVQKSDGAPCEDSRACVSQDCDHDADVCVTRTFCH